MGTMKPGTIVECITTWMATKKEVSYYIYRVALDTGQAIEAMEMLPSKKRADGSSVIVRTPNVGCGGRPMPWSISEGDQA